MSTLTNNSNDIKTSSKTAKTTMNDQEILDSLEQVLLAATKGDIDQRVFVPEGDSQAATLSNLVNQLLDFMDAFIRESHGTLDATSKGHFYRRFLPHGMVGQFQQNAKQIDEARNAMQQKTIESTEKVTQEATEVSEAVSKSANKLNDTALLLSMRMDNALEQATLASQEAKELSTTSNSIDSSVHMIEIIARNTRLLALNSAI